MPSKTLVTFLAKITFMPKALTYKNAITLLLFKNWLVCVCVCVQPQRFQVPCSFSSLLFIRSYTTILPLPFQIINYFSYHTPQRKNYEKRATIR